MPWPSSVLEPSALFTDASKLQSRFDDYVRLALRPQWTSAVEALTTLIDFRDFAEDTLADLKTIMKAKSDMPLGLEALVKSLKNTNVPDRKVLTVAFLTENALCLRASISLATAPSSLVAFVIEAEIESFNAKAREICKYRPVLTAPRVTVERIAAEMDTKAQTLEAFKKHAEDLGTSSLWPVYALFKAVERGEVEDLFLHAPLPRVFGAPSCVRNGIERRSNPAKLVTGNPRPLSLEKCVLSAKGRLAWRQGSKWTVMDAKHTGLVASLPGLPYVWTMDPDTMSCGIYTSTGLAVEFDLPKDSEVPNWIDCQRDPEGALVLMWGHINPLTGSLGAQNACAFDEDALVQSSTLEFLDAFVPLKARRSPGARVDWRDHGNLLSVHHTVEDDASAARKWVHTFEVVFGNNLLMTLTTDLRPIEAVFGCPTDMILLSPLSSKALQHWKLDNGAYAMTTSEEAPPGRWTSLTVV